MEKNQQDQRSGLGMREKAMEHTEYKVEAEDLVMLVEKLQKAGTLEPRIEDLIIKIKDLQRVRKNANEELLKTRAHSEALQRELDELNAEKAHLEEILNQKQETLMMLRLQCEEKQAEAQRQQEVSQGCKQRIEELSSKIQEEKLKQRKQRMEFDQQLEEMMEKHKSLWEFHTSESLAREISNIEDSKKHLLNEEKVVQKKIEDIMKQLETLSQPGAAFDSEGLFLRSEEAIAAVHLFEEENEKATEFLEAASRHHLELQQKYQRLKTELESYGSGSEWNHVREETRSTTEGARRGGE
ncbi:synaptonemal complex central element protein 1-like [Ornithorhynchus anatinus]|uniref:synaptonemal complex central element protein 1-like n=1 Tax=Ornithorhynchus anatinus TaxID=9258 RepID=UPI0010A81542|nr:synaptonemal complex central element protein 1-like [Ornithorhynchus anatinus]